jgi:hypothetical protein
MDMVNKIFGIFICALLIFTAVFPVTANINANLISTVEKI